MGRVKGNLSDPCVLAAACQVEGVTRRERNVALFYDDMLCHPRVKGYL